MGILDFLARKLPFIGDEAVARGTRKVMMNSYNAICHSEPNRSETYYLKESLRKRFRHWSDFELDTFINIPICLDIDDLIEKIIEYESKGMI